MVRTRIVYVKGHSMLFVFVLMMKFTVWCMIASVKLTVMCARLMWPLLVFLTKMMMVGGVAVVALVGGALAKRGQRGKLQEHGLSRVEQASVEQ